MNTKPLLSMPNHAIHQEPDGGNLVDAQQIRNYSGFVLRAVRRHTVLVTVVFAGTVAATVAGVIIWPKTYHVEAKLLARRNDLMTSLSNPSRPARPEADDPTRAASELIHQRDNLLSIINETDLLASSERDRSPLRRLNDRLASLFHETTLEDRRNALVGTLQQKLVVTVEKEGIVRIEIDWRDARTASAIAQVAVRNFINTRHATETEAITEAISILQQSAASLQSDVDQTIAQLRDEQSKRPTLTRASHVDHAKPVPVARSVPTAEEQRPIVAPSPSALAELGRLNAALDVKRQEIKRLQSLQRQQVSELETRLNAALVVYTEDHPTVAALRQNMAAASREPAELTALREEAATIEDQYTALDKAARDESAAVHVATRAPTAPAGDVTPPPKSPDRAPNPDGPLLAIMPTDIARLTDVTHPTSRLLTLQLAQLANLLDRINSARLELATSSAGLNYRYSVTRPPEVPSRPIRPNVLAVVVAGLVAAFVLSVSAAVAADLTSDLLIEPWQLDRQLGVSTLIVTSRLSAE